MFVFEVLSGLTTGSCSASGGTILPSSARLCNSLSKPFDKEGRAASSDMSGRRQVGSAGTVVSSICYVPSIRMFLNNEKHVILI